MAAGECPRPSMQSSPWARAAAPTTPGFSSQQFAAVDQQRRRREQEGQGGRGSDPGRPTSPSWGGSWPPNPHRAFACPPPPLPVLSKTNFPHTFPCAGRPHLLSSHIRTPRLFLTSGAPLMKLGVTLVGWVADDRVAAERSKIAAGAPAVPSASCPNRQLLGPQRPPDRSCGPPSGPGTLGHSTGMAGRWRFPHAPGRRSAKRLGSSYCATQASRAALTWSRLAPTAGSGHAVVKAGS